jgi:hypothetical protein
LAKKQVIAFKRAPIIEIQIKYSSSATL